LTGLVRLVRGYLVPHARAVFGIMGADRTVNPHPPRRRRPKNHPARSR
jgi:hypothetical protein